tara:strand:- start:2924 stop:3112 length:189 start_codon:yes stop_codon:yes gene_type:complete
MNQYREKSSPSKHLILISFQTSQKIVYSIATIFFNINKEMEERGTEAKGSREKEMKEKRRKN